MHKDKTVLVLIWRMTWEEQEREDNVEWHALVREITAYVILITFVINWLRPSQPALCRTLVKALWPWSMSELSSAYCFATICVQFHGPTSITKSSRGGVKLCYIICGRSRQMVHLTVIETIPEEAAHRWRQNVKQNITLTGWKASKVGYNILMRTTVISTW